MTGNTAAAPGDDPGRPAQEQPVIDCKHWIGAEGRYCRSGDGVRRYIHGHRCRLHSPWALEGRPEPPPGPGWPVHREERS